ncbi:MAG: protein kinase [Chitinivibrionales bacterium]|nr:protein kinase [Chitinivibrionales bacterium]
MIPKLPKGFTHPMRIGEGGFSSVYRVRQTRLDRWVAIKIIHEKDPEKKRLLLKEGKTQAQLQIGSIPRVYDAFEWKNKIYIVMEWINGVPLNEMLIQPLQDIDRLCIADSVVSALGALHSLGYAHRDLKPQNILLSPDKGLSFIDFGFTKQIVDSKVSMIGTVKGTPAYMAPELWRGKERIDYMRTDIYSAGLILKEILGDLPESSITDRLLSENPLQRCGSGKELYEAWINLTQNMHFVPGWQDVAEALCSEALTGELCDAARELIAARRDDEAYWLLVECLEVDPDNVEALSLLDDLTGRPKVKPAVQRLSYGAAAGVLVIAVAAAFFVGRKSNPVPMSGDSGEHSRRAMSGMMKNIAEKSMRVPTSLPLRRDVSHHGKLTGRIYLANPPSKGDLRLDNRTFDYEGIRRGGITVPYGSHTLAWQDEKDNIVWREKVALLPFQTKIINMPEGTVRKETGGR